MQKSLALLFQTLLRLSLQGDHLLLMNPLLFRLHLGHRIFTITIGFTLTNIFERVFCVQIIPKLLRWF